MALPEILFFKIFKIQGHPLKLFRETICKIKKRFVFLLKLFYKQFKNTHINMDCFSITLKKTINFSFFYTIKNESRKKKYQISIEETKYNFYYFVIKYLELFFVKRENNFFLQKIIKFFIKKFIILKEKQIPSCLCFLKEKQVAFGFLSGKVSIFDVYKKKYKFQIKNSNSTLFFLESHPLKNLLLGLRTKTIDFWNFFLDTKKIQILSLKEFHPIVCCSFRINKIFIDFMDHKKILKSFDIENQKWISRIKFEEFVFYIKNNKDGNLISIRKKNSIGVFDFRINKEIIILKTKTHSILHTEWEENEKSVVISTKNNFISIWDLRNLKKQTEIKYFGKSIDFFKIHLNWLLACKNKKKITLWDLFTNKKIKNLIGYKTNVFSVGMSPCGSFFYSNDFDKIIVSFF